jgi:hypothetical protein
MDETSAKGALRQAAGMRNTARGMAGTRFRAFLFFLLNYD